MIAKDNIDNIVPVITEFASTRVALYHPERVLDSAFAMDLPTEPVFRTPMSKTNSCWLTSEEALRPIFCDENQRELTEEDVRQYFADLDSETLE